MKSRYLLAQPVAVVTALALCLVSLDALAQSKRVMDHDVYGVWNAIQGERLSPDGNWLVYSLVPDEGDASLVARHVESDLEHRVPRGTGARITPDGRFAVFTIRPQFEVMREARRAGKKPDEQPKDSLGILTVAMGELEKIPRVKSFAVAEEGPSVLVYHLEKPLAEVDTTAAEENGDGESSAGQNDNDGSELVVRDLGSGRSAVYQRVTAYALSKNGSRVLFATASDGEDYTGGVYVLSAPEEEARRIFAGEGKTAHLTVHDSGDRVAFLSDRDDHQAEEPEYSLFVWTAGQDSARMAAGGETAGVSEGWWVSRHGALSFSDDGRRLFFGTAPVPQEREDIPDDEKVVLDIWNWQDDQLQPMQVVRSQQERERSHRAVVHLDDLRIVQLGRPEIPTVIPADRGDADLALGISNLPYQREISWDFPGRSDVYLISLRTGERERIVSGVRGNPALSPTGRYVSWYENADSTWYVFDSGTRRTVDVGEGIPHPLFDELHDRPFEPFSYGSAGWTEGDRRFLVYDAYDVWSVDPAGRDAPENVTRGVGRENEIRFRYVRTDPDARFIDPSEPLLLSALDTGTMAAGFYTLDLSGRDGPRSVLFSDHRYGTPREAAEAEVLLFTRESFEEFGDLWVADGRFGNPKKISDANPQQSEYVWGTAELVEWISADGEPVRGIVHKPEDFDPSRQYPMMVYFYERVSQTLHQHWAPVPHRSIINPTFYASRGYVVFKPDIPYKIGYPGESAYNAVVPGVLHMIGKGYIDRDRIGVMGHSWGGYQAAYLITRTDVFAAAHAGAPVSNMISAYGGIRWQTGMSRMFQYERTQSRIGGSLWEYPLRYIENSPIFWAYKVETPLLMMHNDQDGAVPWEQGIEMFVALRRLGKPVWMLNYNDEPHWVLKRQNQLDFARRMQQFFDHYLKDAPMPRWMAEGVPAVDRGYESGFEYVGEPPVTQE